LTPFGLGPRLAWKSPAISISQHVLNEIAGAPAIPAPGLHHFLARKFPCAFPVAFAHGSGASGARHGQSSRELTSNTLLKKEPIRR
jgi:hypothetical protein